MSYCLNADCPKPYNPPRARFCQACGMRLLLGDRYRSVQPIGQGNTSRTFVGIDTHKLIDNRCLIKAFSTESGIESIRRDVERLESVRQHPQLPTLLAYFERENTLYFVQEFVDGMTLEQELTRHGAFTEEGIWKVLTAVLPLLHFLHQHRVIHRDVKPANLLRRTSDQQLMLVDFGSAKYTTPSNLLKTGTLVGSAEYAPLEQLMGRTVYASDLYSLGFTCIHLLTGLPPFELFNASDGSWVWRSVSGPVSAQLETVLNSLLERDVQHRYASVEAVVSGAGDRLSHLNLSFEAQPQPPVSTPEPESQWVRRQTFTHPGGLTAIAFTPNGRLLITGSNDSTIRLWDISSELCVHMLTDHRAAISSLAVSPDGRILASSSWDQSLRLWNLETGLQTHLLQSNQREVTELAIAPSGSQPSPLLLVSASRDARLYLWNLTTGEWQGELIGHRHPIEAIAVSGPHPILASGDGAGTVNIWHLGTQERLRTLSKHEASVNAIAISAEQEAIATGSSDTTVRLRQLNTGGALQTLTDHQSPVSAIAFSPDGQLLATGDYSGAVKLWRLDSGRCIQTLQQHTQPIVAIAFDALNHMLVSGSRDGTLHVWHCP